MRVLLARRFRGNVEEEILEQQQQQQQESPGSQQFDLLISDEDETEEHNNNNKKDTEKEILSSHHHGNNSNNHNHNEADRKVVPPYQSSSPRKRRETNNNNKSGGGITNNKENDDDDEKERDKKRSCLRVTSSSTTTEDSENSSENSSKNTVNNKDFDDEITVPYLDRKPSAKTTTIIKTPTHSLSNPGHTTGTTKSTITNDDNIGITNEAVANSNSTTITTISTRISKKEKSNSNNNKSSNNNKNNSGSSSKNNMVSGGSRRNYPFSREGEDVDDESEELRWRYRQQNHHHNHDQNLHHNNHHHHRQQHNAAAEEFVHREMDPENDDNENDHDTNVPLVYHSGTRSREQEESLRRRRPELLEFTENNPASARGDDNNNSNKNNNNTITSPSFSNNNNNNDHGRVTMIRPMATTTTAMNGYTSNHDERNDFSDGIVVRERQSLTSLSSSLPAAATAVTSIKSGDKFKNSSRSSASLLLPTTANNNYDINNSKRREHELRVSLKKRGLEIREQDGDGNCLFRAISLQVYGDPNMHGDVRKQCMDHMERDQGHFSQFVTGEPFLQYIARTRQDGVHGNNPEIQASSELFNRPIEVFTPENGGSSPLNILHAEYKTGDVPIRLSYHDGNHYNAVIDPLVPTAGLGLGLPGLKPGLADKMQMAKAVAESDAAADQMELQKVMKTSEDDELQRAIKESKLSAEHKNSNAALSLSDMDATYFELEQAALERSLKSYSQNEHGKKQRASSSSSSLPYASTSMNNYKKSSSSNNQIIPGGDHKAPAVAVAAASAAAVAAKNNVAFLPCPSQESIPLAASVASIPPAAASASATVATTATARSESPLQGGLQSVEEYPSSVQELVMNGFTLSAVGKAFDLVGNNFDDMLSLLLSNNTMS